MQDVCSTDPTQETCPTVGHTYDTASTRQHEPDHTDQESICPAWQIQIMNCSAVVAIDDLFVRREKSSENASLPTLGWKAAHMT